LLGRPRPCADLVFEVSCEFGSLELLELRGGAERDRLLAT
jgi:hypothetical protein